MYVKFSVSWFVAILFNTGLANTTPLVQTDESVTNNTVKTDALIKDGVNVAWIDTCDFHIETTDTQIFVSIFKCLEIQNPQISVLDQIFNHTLYSNVKYCLETSEANAYKMAIYYDKKSLKEKYLPSAEQVIDMLQLSNKLILHELLCRNIKIKYFNEEEQTLKKTACESLKFIFNINSTLFQEIVERICYN